MKRKKGRFKIPYGNLKREKLLGVGHFQVVACSTFPTKTVP